MDKSILNNGYGYCPAMEGSTLEFNVDGSIRTCGHTNTIIGTNGNLNQVLNPNTSFINLITERFPSKNTFCTGCVIEGACAGQCHVTIESSKRDKALMDNMCQLMKGMTNQLISSYLDTHVS